MSNPTNQTDMTLFSRAMQQNPLGVGLAALSLGALVALLLPVTEPENRLMGETRDQLIDKAHDAVGELRNKVGVIAGVAQVAAHDALDTVKDSASEALSTVKDSASEALSTVKDSASEALSSVKDSVVDEVKHQGLVPEQK